MPALHRRNVPNCRPMADGGMRKCSAGACPPLGSGRGVAESAAPIRCTKPQLRLFIPWRAGAGRPQLHHPAASSFPCPHLVILAHAGIHALKPHRKTPIEKPVTTSPHKHVARGLVPSHRHRGQPAGPTPTSRPAHPRPHGMPYNSHFAALMTLVQSWSEELALESALLRCRYRLPDLYAPWRLTDLDRTTA